MLRAASSTRVRLGVQKRAYPSRQRVFCSTKMTSVKGNDVSMAVGISAGTFAGVLSALTSVGGGMVLVPTLAKLTTMPMQMVNATCFTALTASAIVGSYNYAEADAINYPLAILTSVPGMVFTRWGVSMAQRIPSKRLASIVGAGMLISVPSILLKSESFRSKLPDWMPASSPASSLSVATPRNQLDLQYYTAGSAGSLGAMARAEQFYEAVLQNPVAFLQANLPYLTIGAAAGFLSGLCGIGGAMITTTYLSSATDVPQSVVVGTALISGLPVCVPTNYYNYKANLIHFPTAAKLGASLVVGVYGTSKLVLDYHVPDELLRGVFALIVSAAGIAMIRRPI